jgi:hypothetical protein
MNVTTAQIPPNISRPLPAILWGGLIGGTLDILYASVMTVLSGNTPDRMLKGIAAGLLGRGAIAGGLEIAALGLTLHSVIALGASTIYYLASRKLTFMVTRAPLCGPLFGAIVYLVMNRVVLPLSALAVSPRLQLPGLLAVMFFIGLPIALSVRHFSK